MNSTDAFLAARDFLLTHREDYEQACAGFRWPHLEEFNWAIDFFDVQSQGNHRPALRIVEHGGPNRSYSFETLRVRSNQAANFLRKLGVVRGDRILVMLPNMVALWEIILGAMKIGAVVSPASILLSPVELTDRLSRGQIRFVVTDSANTAKFSDTVSLCTRILVDAVLDGWVSYADADSESQVFVADAATRSRDPLMLYFTSGTTARPKMVLHTFASYPVGHLSTMYWIGLRPQDLHWNISSPGWAKHAWSSFFAPWNAGATIYVYNQTRFAATAALEALVRDEVTSLCAPPTVWRSLILQDLTHYPVRLREIVSAGEPLNPEIIERIRAAWGITLRDGYGQTETTCIIGNPPGQRIKPGSMGRPMPGYRVCLLDDAQDPADSGEINIELGRSRPIAVTAGHEASHFPTADLATRDTDGYYWYLGRNDDVFKSSDYRISPFELESLLLEHPSVAEAAVVPSPDPVRLAVPKAIVVLKPDTTASRAIAQSILRFAMQRAPAYRRIRRIEFRELPKTISGKIRRIELRQREEARGSGTRFPMEFWEEDLREE